MKNKILLILFVISIGINIGILVAYIFHSKQAKSLNQTEYNLRESPLRYRLNLRNNQLDTIEALQKKMVSEISPLREKLDSERVELMNLLKEPKPDKAKLDEVIKEIANLQAELELHAFRNAQKIKSTLTPQQQQQFLELFEKRLCPQRMHRQEPNYKMHRRR